MKSVETDNEGVDVLIGSGLHWGEPRVRVLVGVDGAVVADCVWTVEEAQTAIEGLEQAIRRCRENTPEDWVQIAERGGSSS